jgi:predicted LPLAT superfamily acyltransferase
MKKLFYILLIRLSQLLGPWIFVLISRVIAAGYFFLFPRRVAVGVRFYRTLFPGRSLFYYLLCTWKQFQNFTSVFLDRFSVMNYDDVTYTSGGMEHLEAATGKTGGILLMSHMGNWEAGAHLLRLRHNFNMLLYMGIQDKEQIEGLQKEDLQKSGIQIIAVDQGQGSPFDILEGVQFLNSGGFVSLTGDRLWRNDQRVVSVKFLGRDVFLPEIPYLLAFLSGAPLFVFFGFRTGRKQFHFSVSEPIFVTAPSRAQRGEVIRQSAQKYADLLERTAREHPFEWYHFEPFLGRGVGNTHLLW